MVIKYILKELKVLYKTEGLIISLIFLCIFSACMLMFFSFGFVHHLEQKKIDAESGEKELVIYFYNPEWSLEKKKDTVKENRVNKGELLDVLCNLEEKVLKDCSEIVLECKYDDDVVEDLAIDNSTLSACVDCKIEKGMVVSPDIEEELKVGNILVDGRYFNEEDIKKRSNVCIAPDMKSGNLTGEYEYWLDKYLPDENGYYTIDGRKFECIGHMDTFTQIPKIPFNQVRDDVFVKNVCFIFDHVITFYTYETICEELYDKYGDQVMVWPIEIRQVDSYKFYGKIIIALSVMALISVIMIWILYDYMIMRRRRFIHALKICGIGSDELFKILIGEIMIILLCSYCVSVLVFHYFIIPLMARSFEYLPLSYGFLTYLKIGILFGVISYLFLITMIAYKINRHNG